MTPVLPIKCSKPGLSQHGAILRLGGKSLIRILLWQGSGGDVIGLWERLIMNYRQPTWLDRNQDWPHFYEGMWVVCWKALPYLFTRATLAQKSKKNQLRCTRTKCATHFIIFHFYSHQKNMFKAIGLGNMSINNFNENFFSKSHFMPREN